MQRCVPGRDITHRAAPPVPSPAARVGGGSAPLLSIPQREGWGRTGHAGHRLLTQTDHFSQTNGFSTAQSITQNRQIKAAAAGLVNYTVTCFQISYRRQAQIGMLSAMPCNYCSQPCKEVSAGQRLPGADQQSISYSKSEETAMVLFWFLRC